MVVGSQTALTIPELLLILEVVRHLKCHTVVAGGLSESSSPSTQALNSMGQRRKAVGVFGSWHNTSGKPRPATIPLLAVACVTLQGIWIINVMDFPPTLYNECIYMLSCSSSLPDNSDLLSMVPTRVYGHLSAS